MRKSRLGALNLDLPADLPITEQAGAISELLAEHSTIVVAGETGSGKTTQLPRICMQMGLGSKGLIGHTQPRRLAARTVARRIATECGCELGTDVGFAVRFAESVGPDTLVKVMTDGLLLTEIRSDPWLSAYEVIIIDEAHERSLNIDFLLGYLKRLQQRRDDLKIIITSATIDLERFSTYFNNAPIVTVSGRTYPVTTVYCEPAEEGLTASITEILEDIETRPGSHARDVLVFLSGEQEIFATSRGLRRALNDRYEILPLYARLSYAEQQKIFQRGSGLRRIVLSTNVAETSLTVPNIGYVIDPGFARINRYSYRSKLQRLPVEAISQASADQRKGRCGRVAPGVCYRLYDEEDFRGRQAFTDPEIHRVNLASVLLQMQAFNLGQIETFPFIEPPDPRAIKDARTLLTELRALDAGRLTDTGRLMARLPIDPRLARMLVESTRQGALKEMLILVAGLSIVDPRERPAAKAQAADEAHERFLDEKSDFLAHLNLWQWLEELRLNNSNSRFNRILTQKFVNAQRVREWRELHRQLKSVVRDLKLKENETPASYGAIHECIVSGSLSLIAQHDEKGRYQGARNLSLRIFPGSGLAKASPRWLVAAEIAETSRVYGRNVAAIEPGWIERQSQHLLKHQYSSPVWHAKRGEVVAHQTSLLYGLRVVDRKTVSYAKVDPVLCQDLLIREGLVPGQVREKLDFLEHNLEQVRRVQDWEAKGRRRDLLVSDDWMHEWYAKRLPGGIQRISDLIRWLRKSAENGARLQWTLEDLLASEEGRVGDDEYPGTLQVEDVSFRLQYRFAPGDPSDGVQITVPVGLLNMLGVQMLDWSVPGFLPLLVEQWLRSLPKNRRRQLVPLPDTARTLCRTLLKPEHFRNGRLLSAMSRLIQEQFRVQVDEGDWQRERVDPWLFPLVHVEDEHGKIIASNRDLAALKSELSGAAEVTSEGVVRAVEQLEATGLQAFPDHELTEQVVLGDKRQSQVRYPGLVDEGTTAGLRLFETKSERDAAMRAGLSRLALVQLGQVSRYFRKEIDKHKNLGLHFATLGSAAELKEQLMINVVWFCFFEGQPTPKDAAAFAARLVDRRPALADIFNDTASLLAQILSLRFDCVRRLQDMGSPGFKPSCEDIAQHLERLAPADLLSRTSFKMLGLRVRYLEGIEYRLQSLAGRVPRDRELLAVFAKLQARIDGLSRSELFNDETAHMLQLTLEEVRLKAFAEPVAKRKVSDHPLQRFLGNAWKVSEKKLRDLLLAEEKRLGLA